MKREMRFTDPYSSVGRARDVAIQALCDAHDAEREFDKGKTLSMGMIADIMIAALIDYGHMDGDRPRTILDPNPAKRIVRRKK